MTFYAINDIGTRKINEDSLYIAKNNERTLFCLADGLGGHGKGDEASQLVISKAIEVFRADEDSGIDVVSQCFEEAQKTLLEQQSRLCLKNEMKTTFVCLVICGMNAKWGHIGDSRLYWFRKARIIKRTLDHSVPQMLVDCKEIKEKQIRFHEDRNRLLRVMGMKWDSLGYELSEDVSLLPNDSFLLCSDGFWEWITEKEMEHFLKKSKTVREWGEKMKDCVIKRGAGKDMDNYSAIAVFL